MANISDEPEQESDEDCEVYFLKPVNEYNIVDRIKEANKELFSNEDRIDNELISEAQQSRKVSFAANLEQYEPQNGINLKELEDTLGMDCMQTNEAKQQKIQIGEKLDIIAEEVANEIEINETNYRENKKQEEPYLTAIKDSGVADNFIESEKNNLKCSSLGASLDKDTILEEICEEILIMDMENDKFEDTVLTKFNTHEVRQRKMLKQITFDYTEHDDEVDNKSLTNLLIPENENYLNEDSNQEYSYNFNESINSDTDTEDKIETRNTEYYDDGEDDKLSIIVASYLSDDNMDRDKTSLTSSSNKSCSKTRKLLFNKGFSFRRKTKSSNAISSYSNQHVSNNRRFMPPPEVTDLKLHYKTCCEFKNEQQNLPKYTGYLSEYGLSREQLIKRENKLQQKQEGKVMEILKTSEAEMRKIHDNERAFTTWLKNKMRYPINKTRNMFDVRRPFGLRKWTGVEGNPLSNDTKRILDTTKYRSISAKLKKPNFKI